MKVYTDIFTGDELLSDSYPMKLVDDVYFEVEGKNITISHDIDEALIGGNKVTATEGGEASAEDAGGNYDAASVTGINVVMNHKLVETPFDKASFKDWIKTYSKKTQRTSSRKFTESCTTISNRYDKSGERNFGKIR